MNSYFLSLVAPQDRVALTSQHLEAARSAVSACGMEPGSETTVLALDWAAEFTMTGPASIQELNNALAAEVDLDGIDRAVQYSGPARRKAVLVSDMDSTMIAIETLDTLAAELGFGEQVAAITKRSMDGELDFVESLRQRVALLKGFKAQVALDAVMAKVTHTPGAEVAVRTLVQHGCLCALVSGGFTFTTEIVHKALGFQEHAANTLEIGPDGCFTGALTGRIVGRETKLEILSEMAGRQGVDLSATAAIGDGANDLDMLMAAGLGIGFQPKPIVRDHAAQVIEHTDMRSLLFYQGYRAAEFVF